MIISDLITELSSDFADWFGVTDDGQRGWKEPGADTVFPFRRSIAFALSKYRRVNASHSSPNADTIPNETNIDSYTAETYEYIAIVASGYFRGDRGYLKTSVYINDVLQDSYQSPEQYGNYTNIFQLAKGDVVRIETCAYYLGTFNGAGYVVYILH